MKKLLISLTTLTALAPAMPFNWINTFKNQQVAEIMAKPNFTALAKSGDIIRISDTAALFNSESHLYLFDRTKMGDSSKGFVDLEKEIHRRIFDENPFF